MSESGGRLDRMGSWLIRKCYASIRSRCEILTWYDWLQQRSVLIAISILSSVRVKSISRYFALAVVMLAFTLPLVAADDIVVADFEGESYGKWRSSGEAFGAKPASGTLQMQLPVPGFRGAGLVNSYRGGDKTKGTLTSPPPFWSNAAISVFLSVVVASRIAPVSTCFMMAK